MTLYLLLSASAQSSSQETSKQQKDRAEVQRILQESYGLFKPNDPTAMKAAFEKANEANELSVRIGYKEGEAYSLAQMGNLQAQLDNRTKAIEFLSKAIQLLEAIGAKRDEAKNLIQLGYELSLDSQWEKAQSALQEAVRLHREIGDKIGEASATNTLGLLFQKKGDKAQALVYFQQGLSLSRSIGDKNGEGYALLEIGDVLRDQGEKAKALENYESALNSFRVLRDDNGQVFSLLSIGRLHEANSNDEAAIAHYEQALPMIHRTFGTKTELNILKKISDLWLKLGNMARAKEYDDRFWALQKNPGSQTSSQSSSAKAVDKDTGNGPASNTPREVAGATTSVGSPKSNREKLETARKLLAEGIALYKEGDEQSFKTALEKAAEARRLFQEAGDRSGEAFVLHGVGYIYIVLGETTKALDYFRQALTLRRDAGDKRGEAITETNIAVIYGMLGDISKELYYHQQSLNLYRSVGEKNGEAAALNSIGIVLEGRGEAESGLDHYKQALTLYKELRDKTGEASALALLGGAFKSLGDKTKALEYFENSLSLLRSRSSNQSTSRPLGENLFSTNYAELTEAQKALEYFKLSFVLGSVVEDKQSEAGVLNSIGRLYHEVGEYGKSLQYYQQALALYRKLGDKNGIAITLDAIGSAYGAWGEANRAVDYGNQALSMFRESGDKSGEAMELNNLALSYIASGQKQKAFEYYQQSLLLNSRLQQKRNVAITLSNLMWLLSDSNQVSEAIFYGKQSVNTLQELRSNIRNTDRNLQRSYLSSIEGTYRFLADLLITQGRLPEAQEVLNLLKEQEFFEFVRRDSSEGSSLNGKATLTPEEAALAKRYREIADRLTALAAERAELVNRVNRSPEEEKRLALLDKDITDSNKIFQQFLVQLGAEFARPKQAARLEQIEESEGLMDTLRRLGPGTVALYTLVGNEKYRVILVTADVRKAYEYPIKSADLNRKVLAFRDVLQTPSRDPRPLAREMYNILIGPELARDLHQAKAQTLMWSLDGVLRYLPMAALHDGKQYFVESYRNVVFTPASHSRLNNPVTEKWRGLGLGVSKPQEGFVGLAGVPEELRGIIRDEASKTSSGGVLPGRVILDAAFTETAMETALRQSYPVVHIASHFRFQPGNETQSFLLLGDGKHFTLAEIKNMGQLFSGVDLLTLSACNTAVGDRLGDGKEVESFGVIAQKKGAGAVMASLWPVMDESTQLFMREFYHLHSVKPNITKGGTLREAQLALLRGQIRAGPVKIAAKNLDRGTGSVAGQPRFETDPKAPFAHPYFWAPFILIGNWK